MGKRKERRQAALGNTGRRVKLDLFAEPSGDLGGTTEHDQVGETPKDSAGLPNSPSSSASKALWRFCLGNFPIGQVPQNPLLLLGQYSDEDLGEESELKPILATVESSSPHNDEQAAGSPGDGCNDIAVNTDKDLALEKVEELHVKGVSTLPDDYYKLDDGNIRENDATDSANLHKVDSNEQIAVAGTSEVQVVGDVGLGWKILMHEESNQYYYWNTETGETSWEVPNILGQPAVLTSNQEPVVPGTAVSVPFGTYESNSVLGVESNNCSAAQIIGTVYINGVQDAQLVGHTVRTMDDKSCVADVSSGAVEFKSNTVAVNDPPSSGADYLSDAPGVHFDYKTGNDLSTRLLRQAESLLEKLTSLKGLDGDLQDRGKMLKYSLEVEVRLADIKALISYGSSLLPYWVHLESQLKRVEGDIDDEIYQLAKSAVMDEVEATYLSSSEDKDKSNASIENEPKADGNSDGFESSDEMPLVCSVDALHGNVGSENQNLGSSASVSEPDVKDLIEETNPSSGFTAAEDDDMDVDMEVDDAILDDSATLTSISGDKNIGLPLSPSEEKSSLLVNDAVTVPPPPEEEWVPPPPPDNEQVPPPPPDHEQVFPPPPDNEQIPPPLPGEIPGQLYPPLPSYTETAQPVTYMEQYGLTYPDPNFQYYGHVVPEVPGSSFYEHVDGSQVAIPNTSIYYGTVPNTYGGTATVMVNAVEPVAYYNLKEEKGPHLHVDSNVDPSKIPVESSIVSYNATASVFADAVAVEEPNMKVNDFVVGDDTETVSSGVTSASATIQASATYSVRDSASTQVTNDVSLSVAAPSSSTKVQTKAVRKKRSVAVAPTLRSNKKVSSLVDKWKAAKEELEDDEDEPENALEILERKREREIKEWYAKQIASGEAKDNANFQPLGGDWRNRVKRRRAQASREVAKIAQEAHNDEKTQQPDLVEQSKGLPSGWRAYWDDSSKQVYYGNTNTSETTWNKPTK